MSSYGYTTTGFEKHKTKQKQHHLRKNRTELKKPTQSSPLKSSSRDDCRCNSLAPTHPEVSWSMQVEGTPQPCSLCKPESQCVCTQQKLRNATAGIWRWGLSCRLLPFGLMVLQTTSVLSTGPASVAPQDWSLT